MYNPTYKLKPPHPAIKANGAFIGANENGKIENIEKEGETTFEKFEQTGYKFNKKEGYSTIFLIEINEEDVKKEKIPDDIIRVRVIKTTEKSTFKRTYNKIVYLKINGKYIQADYMIGIEGLR